MLSLCIEYFLYKLKGFVDKGHDDKKLIFPKIKLIVSLSTTAMTVEAS